MQIYGQEGGCFLFFFFHLNYVEPKHQSDKHK